MGYSDEHKWAYKAISAYKEVSNPNEWLPCPICGLIPLVWEFDNGRFTACECGENEYNHHTIQAESVVSVIKRKGDYYPNELRDNWNHWVKTGEDLYMKKKLNI